MLMASISNRERLLKDKVIENCWQYLHDNFHKFSEPNKIKLLVALCGKSVPQEIQGNITSTVIMGEIRKDEEPLRFNIGSFDSSKNTGYPGETPSYN